MTAGSEASIRIDAPFDTARADRLMEEAGIDVLLATSKHNAGYLLGGYRFFFFSTMDAIGHSRYLPIVIYVKGRPEEAAYIGNAMEGWEHANRPFWTPTVHLSSWGTTDAAKLAIAHLGKTGKAGARIGIEPGFLPADAHAALTEGTGSAGLADATGVLERLRAIKTPAELAKLRTASELITESMLATIAWAREGSTKLEIVERMRREETNRGLEFDYCLLTFGVDKNRAPSGRAWKTGEIMSIDSGGNHDGYIGDLCRMTVLGEPDAELQDLLAEVDGVQQAVFAEIRAGAIGGDVIACGNEVLKSGPNSGVTDLVIHGMGLVSHEVPFLINNRIYDGVDAERPLKAGMVLSVETTMAHARRGYIKLEDTVAVTADGYELFGDRGRGWNRGGSSRVPA
ncbi:MAG: Xaa-Pro peptidase family protein [Hyphomicrobiales bacterium]|nr:Xaa-Pro peptidase family protein [Hyphomicrobiales bacterium]